MHATFDPEAFDRPQHMPKEARKRGSAAWRRPHWSWRVGLVALAWSIPGILGGLLVDLVARRSFPATEFMAAAAMLCGAVSEAGSSRCTSSDDSYQAAFRHDETAT